MPGKARSSLMSRVADPQIRKYLYLDLTVDALITKLTGLALRESGDSKDIPFTASIRGYRGAVDSDGDSWLLKAISASSSGMNAGLLAGGTTTM